MAMEKQGNQKEEEGEEEKDDDDDDDEIQEVHTINTVSASCYSSDESMAMKMDLVGSSRFAVPFPLQLTISKKQEYNKYGGAKIHGDSYYDEADVSNMLVRDPRDEILLTMLSAPPPPSRRRHSHHMKSLYVPPKLCNRVLVLDSARVPILCAHRKALSLYNRWDVFRGELPNPEEALFHVKRSTYFQVKTSLHVFLASHKKGSKPQFKVKGNYLERNCTIFRESQIVAEVRRKYTDTNLPLEKNVFVVLVHPGMDYAFIVTLIAIMDEIHREQQYSSSIGSS